MAKSKDTFSKKDKEQKRFKSRQDKRQKMEERKANKKDGNSLEGMMAYLDDNGNLSDTPPDPRIKKIFKQEDMQIGVPKQEHREAEEDVVRMGKVTFFNKSKGFGFINDTTTNERIFFHIKDLLEPIEEMDKVQFQVSQGPRGLNASQVSRTP
jgi:cold shock CspA family protein